MVLRSKNSLLSRSGIGFLIMCSAGLALNQKAAGQSSQLPLQDLSSFKDPGSSWQIAGNVNANLEKENVLRTTEGTGILVNLPGKRKQGHDLYTGFEHGDMDLELDYMMAAGSNSGIYFQGRYELQLRDSWSVINPHPGDNGGIYQRWDESRGKGNEGYEGYAPRQNASKAPGLWQHLKVSFQAPRFDASGRKTENAKILRVQLNGVTIHENIELNGPTRGAIGGDEKAAGPLRIQGDHGAVAFKNIKINRYNTPLPQLSNLQYTVYAGPIDRNADISKLKVLKQGDASAISANSPVMANEYALAYKGTLHVSEAGEYSFSLNTSGGGGMIKVNNQESRGNRTKVNLSAGDVPVEIFYARSNQWGSPSLGLIVSGPGFREAYFGDAITPDQTDPILLHATSNTILRSFIEVPGEPKVVHAVSVGSPAQVHYTYDMDRGMIVQVWRGNFLETTPMWHERGNGTARPEGAVQRFGVPYFTLARLSGEQDAWMTDTTGSGYRPKGYVLDEQDRPTFRYQIFGSTVTDQVRVLPEGHGIQRELTVTAPAADLYAKLAEGTQIETLDKDLYVIDGRAYYLQLQDAGGAKPVVRDANGRKELIIPVRGRLSYSILF